MAVFPTGLPSYTITAGADTPNATAGGLGLSGLLNAFEVDITALATKMGTGAATPSLNKVLVGDGSGTSTWGTTLAGLTLTTPTIASFTNATHTHANAAGGGQLGTSALSNATVTADKLSTGAQAAIVATSETTASVVYADLATTTDSVTVTIGANGLALVNIYASMANPANISYMTFAISGATTLAANDNYAISTSTAVAQLQGCPFLVTSLTAGSNTFKLKYRVSGNTGTYLNRRISVVPL